MLPMVSLQTNGGRQLFKILTVATGRGMRVLERKLGTHLGTRTKSEGKTSFLGGLRALRKALEVNYLKSGGGGRN